MGLYQVKKLLHSKGKNDQNQKKIYRMREKPLLVIRQIKD
jgi:hypothetical protein